MKKMSLFKKVIATTMATSILIGNVAFASDCVDGSFLTQDNESLGRIQDTLRGAYLMTGDSTIAKLGTGYIRAGGSTTAQQTVSTVKVSVIVERYLGGQWLQQTSWSATKNNADLVSSAKNLYVPTGNYYRVRCIHSAYTDTSTSQTNGLYV